MNLQNQVMPKLSSKLVQISNKNNLSLDMKQVSASKTRKNPFTTNAIKKPIQLDAVAQKCQQHHKDPKRRFSLRKTLKDNHTIHKNRQSQLAFAKIYKLNQLISEQKYYEAISLLRQLIINEDNIHCKNHLYIQYADCLSATGKYRQAQQYYSKFLGQNYSCYEVLVKRGKNRYGLGAEDIGSGDLLSAIEMDNHRPEAYLQLFYYSSGNERYKEAIEVLLLAVQANVRCADIYLQAMQAIVNSPQCVSNPGKTLMTVNETIQKILDNSNRQSSEIFCLKGLLSESNHQISQACILYEQSLKFNNHKLACTIALQRIVGNKIIIGDYYSSSHTIDRRKTLYVNQQYLEPYQLLLEGTIAIRRKQYIQGIYILQNLIDQVAKGEKHRYYVIRPLHATIRLVIENIIYKFLAYAEFKLGKYQKSIHSYEKIAHLGHDLCSRYNLLLAEGIVSIQTRYNFQKGFDKFEQAKKMYPNYPQPSIYIAMAIIFRQLQVNKVGVSDIQQQYKPAFSLALNQINKADQTIQTPNSNLLLHRCIIKLYLQEYSDALQDINLCIERAEQNDPKSFFLRGICYFVTQDLQGAINQFTISLSLSNTSSDSLLERAKCYFLIGDTNSGFKDLKAYITLKPADYRLHKWIGDFLYQAHCYRDALKTYTEINEGVLFQAELMKAKCLYRISTFQSIADHMIKLSKHDECEHQRLSVDFLALSLLKGLCTNCHKPELNKRIKALNSKLEQNEFGYIFELIDCMNLLGVATLYTKSYQQSYQLFLLTLQLFNKLQAKVNQKLQSETSQQNLSLKLHDIYLNIAISLLGMKNVCDAVKVMKQALLLDRGQGEAGSNFKAIIRKIENIQEQSFDGFTLKSHYTKNRHIQLRGISIWCGNAKFNCQPVFSLYNMCIGELYAKTINELISGLKPSYVENMPEGPWINRNKYGVIFTGDIVEDEIGSSLLSSARKQDEQSLLQSPINQTEQLPLYLNRSKIVPGSSLDTISHAKRPIASHPKINCDQNMFLTNQPH